MATNRARSIPREVIKEIKDRSGNIFLRKLEDYGFKLVGSGDGRGAALKCGLDGHKHGDKNASAGLYLSRKDGTPVAGCKSAGAHEDFSNVDIFGFMQNYLGVPFPECVYQVAEEVGVDLTPYKYQATEEELKQTVALRKEKESYVDATAMLHRYYQKNLTNNCGGHDILEDRNISLSFAKQYGLGWAPENKHQLWQDIGAELEKKGYTKQKMQEWGLLNGGGQDPQAGRLIFPVRSSDFLHDKNSTPKVVRFSGRIHPDTMAALEEAGEKNIKKWNETRNANWRPPGASETKPLLAKKDVLNGLAEAVDFIRASGKKGDIKAGIVAVEGPSDRLQLNYAGINNVVAGGGVDGFANHFETLFRHTDSVTFCYDGDTAGLAGQMKAALAAAPYAAAGKEVFFMQLPHGEDPDSLLRKNPDATAEERQAIWSNMLATRMSISDFVIDTLDRKYLQGEDGPSNEDKSNAIREAAEFARLACGSAKRMVRIEEGVPVSQHGVPAFAALILDEIADVLELNRDALYSEAGISLLDTKQFEANRIYTAMHENLVAGGFDAAVIEKIIAQTRADLAERNPVRWMNEAQPQAEMNAALQAARGGVEAKESAPPEAVGNAPAAEMKPEPVQAQPVKQAVRVQGKSLSDLYSNQTQSPSSYVLTANNALVQGFKEEMQRVNNGPRETRDSERNAAVHKFLSTQLSRFLGSFEVGADGKFGGYKAPEIRNSHTKAFNITTFSQDMASLMHDCGYKKKNVTRESELVNKIREKGEIYMARVEVAKANDLEASRTLNNTNDPEITKTDRDGRSGQTLG